MLVEAGDGVSRLSSLRRDEWRWSLNDSWSFARYVRLFRVVLYFRFVGYFPHKYIYIYIFAYASFICSPAPFSVQ